MIHAKQYLGIYLEKVTVIALGKKWTVLLHKGAVPNVLEVRAVLHIVNVGAFSLAQQSWTAILGEFVSPLCIEGANSCRLLTPKVSLRQHYLK